MFGLCLVWVDERTLLKSLVMENNFVTSVPGQRVTDSIQTDVTQHLALPVTYAPDQDGNAYAQLAARDLPLSHDRAVVQQVVRLLNSANLSYM